MAPHAGERAPQRRVGARRHCVELRVPVGLVGDVELVDFEVTRAVGSVDGDEADAITVIHGREHAARGGLHHLDAGVVIGEPVREIGHLLGVGAHPGHAVSAVGPAAIGRDRRHDIRAHESPVSHELMGTVDLGLAFGRAAGIARLHRTAVRHRAVLAVAHRSGEGEAASRRGRQGAGHQFDIAAMLPRQDREIVRRAKAHPDVAEIAATSVSLRPTKGAVAGYGDVAVAERREQRRTRVVVAVAPAFAVVGRRGVAGVAEHRLRVFRGQVKRVGADVGIDIYRRPRRSEAWQVGAGAVLARAVGDLRVVVNGVEFGGVHRRPRRKVLRGNVPDAVRGRGDGSRSARIQYAVGAGGAAASEPV